MKLNTTVIKIMMKQGTLEKTKCDTQKHAHRNAPSDGPRDLVRGKR